MKRVHNLLSLPGFEPLGLFQLFSSAPPAAAVAAATHRHLRLMAQSGSGRAGELTVTIISDKNMRSPWQPKTVTIMEINFSDLSEKKKKFL